MTFADFIRSVRRIVTLLDEHDPVPLYKELVGILDQVRAAPTPELQTQVDSVLDRIREQNGAIGAELAHIPHADEVLDSLNVVEYVGDGAIAKLEAMLTKEPYTASTTLSQFIQSTMDVKARLAAINENIAQLHPHVASETPDILLSFKFEGDSEVATTKDLAVRLKEIEKIVHSFARLAGESSAFQDPEIVAVSKASPLTIDIGGANVYVVGVALAQAVKWVMDRIQQTYDIRLQREELKRSERTNETLEVGWDELEKSYLSKEAIREEAERIYKTSKARSTDGSREEVIKAISAALGTLIELVDKGATVRIYLPESKNIPQKEGDLVLQIARGVPEVARKQKAVKQLTAAKPKRSSSKSRPASTKKSSK